MTTSPSENQLRSVTVLADWLRAMEPWRTRDGEVGWFGSGYNGWGVQTNLKYASAAAVVAALHPDRDVRATALDRALGSYRFAWRSHLTGSGTCSDGTSWGNTWISALGLERSWFGLDLVAEHLTNDDRKAVDALICSEATYLAKEYATDLDTRIPAARWHESGLNAPESNLWNGSLLWRAAVRSPGDPAADLWRERSLRFLAGAVSLEADADDSSVFDGRPLGERHPGANFFDSMALDHHGYLNIGYMTICASQAALLHFDLQLQNLPAPDLLHLHQRELWERIRVCLTPDGRLVRIGGDSRVRYTYCQEYVPHAAMYAADRWGDEDALGLVGSYLDLVERECAENPAGAFYARRLEHLARRRPYYYTRLESDRASALAFVAAHAGTVEAGELAPGDHTEGVTAPRSWDDAEHGLVLVRGKRRLASHSWRAYTTTQGICIPSSRGDLAEYHLNLAPDLRFEGGGEPFGDGFAAADRPARQVTARWQAPFDGGFATTGEVTEGTSLAIAEGWSGGPAAHSLVAMVALPDDTTVIGLHLVTTAAWHVGVLEAHGLNLQFPNDVYNGHTRTLRSEHGDVLLHEAPGSDESLRLGAWASVDDALDVVSLDGQPMTLRRRTAPGGGPLHSLRVESLAMGTVLGPRYVAPSTRLVDAAFMICVRGPAEPVGLSRVRWDPVGSTTIRAWTVSNAQGSWTVGINTTPDLERLAVARPGHDLVTGERVRTTVDIPGHRVAVVQHRAERTSRSHGSG